jgi:hypothetical protein
MAKKSSENAPVYVVRSGDRLVGEMEMDRELIRTFPEGQRIQVDLRTGRSPAKLRLYWSFLNKVIDATGAAPSSEALHELVKLETGFTTPIKVKGYTVLVPRSIAFNSMSEQEFDLFLKNSFAFIAETFGVTPEQAFGEAA